MSFRLQKQIWGVQLDPNLKYCLQAMADFANDDGTGIFASVPTIAEKTCYVERTVRRLIKKLVSMGYLILRGKKYKANLYDINLDMLTVNVTLAPDKMSPLSEEKGSVNPDKMSPQTGQNVTLTPDKMSVTPDKMSPKPIINLPIEPTKEKDSENEFSHRDKTDIIQAWFESLPAKPLDEKNPYVKKGYISTADKILEAGYTVEDVERYTAAECAGFYKDKKLAFGKVLANLPAWIKANPSKTEQLPYERELTAEDLAWLEEHNRESAMFTAMALGKMEIPS